METTNERDLEAELARARAEAQIQMELYGYVGVWTAGRIIELLVALGREDDEARQAEEQYENGMAADWPDERQLNDWNIHNDHADDVYDNNWGERGPYA